MGRQRAAHACRAGIAACATTTTATAGATRNGAYAARTVASVSAAYARLGRARVAEKDGFEFKRQSSFTSHRAYAAAAAAASEDDFSILGVKPGCTEDELKKAYRREALKWHPDRHVGDVEKAKAEARFKRISAAYQTLSAPGGRERASYGYSSASSSGASSRAAQAESARRAYEAYQQPGYGASGTEFRYRQDFTRADADRIFREMFGGDSSSFVRELERALREGHARGGFGPMGSVGGFAFRSRGFAPSDLEDMFNAVFGGQTQSGRRPGQSFGGGYSEVRESSYLNARGETVIRRVIRTRGPSGAVSESVTERVVSPGARGGAYYGGSSSSSSSSYGASGGGSARAPPPPGGGGGAVQSVNPLVELAVGAARVARIALARFIATFGARLLQQVIRFLLRRLFGGR